MRRRVAFAGAVLGVLVAAASCSGSGPGAAPGQPSPAPSEVTLSQGGGDTAHPSAAWPMFGRDAARTGVAAGVRTAGRLSISWQAGLDGAVYGQPLLIGQLVIAATENDSIYALDAPTGHVVWRTHVGTPVPLSALPCGNIDPLGITGTPIYDQGNGLVYAVAETSGYHHVLVGVSVTNGAVRVERDIPTPDGQPRYDQQRPALAIEDGRVYVAFGGLYGDCGPYRGSVVGVPLSGGGPIISYVVPTAREGAIWGTAGPVTGPGGTLYVSVGNGSVTSTQFDGSDSVTALSPALQRTGIFAPATWLADSQGDLDLGSTQPALAGSGMLLALGKSGTAYLLNRTHLGGVGGQVAQAQVCPAFGAASVDGSTVYEPCEGGGMAAISVSGGQIRVLWRGPSSAWGSPVVGGGAVWVTDWSAGRLYELNPATGAVRYSVSLGTTLPHFASLSMSGSHAFVGTNDGVTAVAGALSGERLPGGRQPAAGGEAPALAVGRERRHGRRSGIGLRRCRSERRASRSRVVTVTVDAGHHHHRGRVEYCRRESRAGHVEKSRTRCVRAASAPGTTLTSFSRSAGMTDAFAGMCILHVFAPGWLPGARRRTIVVDMIRSRPAGATERAEVAG
jgi:polyvinyl alcohol dehydrogenase (cytochrome)